MIDKDARHTVQCAEQHEVQLSGFKRKKQGGFTLIEVLFALAIAAVSIGAMTYSVSNYLFISGQTRERAITSWLAMNRIVAIKYTRSGVLDSETVKVFQQSYRTTVSSTPSTIPGLEVIEVLSYFDKNKEHSSRLVSLKSLLSQ